jgi:Tol biopolymer transport system component
MTWFDRNGQPLGSIGPIGQYLQFSLSPDDGRVAAVRVDPSSGRSDIWVIDGGGDARQLTFEGARTMNPLWSRDGSDVVFASDRRGRWEIRRKSVDSGEPDEELLSSEYSVVPAHWSADDRLLFFQWHDPRKGNFWLLPMNPGSTPRRLPYLGRDENAGRISPDGRWLASSTWESGWSVHVRPLQSGDGRWQLSAPGQVEPQPRWRADGRELFYLADDMSLTAVAIESGSSFRAGSPHPLFRSLAMAPSGATGNVFDVASDGRRFLMKIPRGTSPITVVANWTALIGVRSPIGK